MSDGSFTPVQQPDFGQTMNNILGLQQKRQALNIGAQTLRSDTAAADQADASNNALKNVQQYTLNGSKSGEFLDKDGKFDPDKYAKGATAVGGIYAQDSIGRMTKMAADLTANHQAVSNLKDSQRQRLGGTLGALATKPDLSLQDVSGAIEDEIKNDPDPNVIRLGTQFLAHLPQNATPTELQQAARRGVMTMQGADQTASETAPQVSAMQGPGGLTPVNLNPNAPGGTGQVGAPMAQGVAPQVTNAGNGQMVVVGNNGRSMTPVGQGSGAQQAVPASGPQSPSNRPRTAQDDAPPLNAPKAVQDAYQKSVADANQHVSDVRTADKDYGNNIAINNTIRHLLPDANTGPGKQKLNDALTNLGLPSGAKTQELGAFLDRQSAALRAQMGLPNTNAGSDEARSISGNTEYDAKVLADKNDYTQSLTEGAHQYRHGLDNVAGFGGQASPKAVDKYKSDWAANFDPNVYKLSVLKGKARADFINSLDPAEAASLAGKKKNLTALSETGRLPQ